MAKFGKQVSTGKLDGARGGGRTTQLVNNRPVSDHDGDEGKSGRRRKPDGDADDVQAFRKGGMVKGRC